MDALQRCPWGPIRHELTRRPPLCTTLITQRPARKQVAFAFLEAKGKFTHSLLQSDCISPSQHTGGPSLQHWSWSLLIGQERNASPLQLLGQALPVPFSTADL